MLMEPSEITTSIRPYDSETADHLEFIGFKMNADLVKHIRHTVDPIRKKMINEMHWKNMVHEAKTMQKLYYESI